MTAATLPAWAFDALVASSLLMIVVLAIRKTVRRFFGAQIAYALWALPALRLVLPSMPHGWRDAATTPITRATETISVMIVATPARPAIDAAAATSDAPSLAVIAIAVWAVGALAFVGWHLIGHARFCRAILSGGRPIERIDGVSVIESDAARGPLAFGVVRRYVAFPRDFADRYDEDERALALAHEIGHHQRGDLIANWIALVVLAIHWLNPLAWYAFRAFRADQELANDARVLAGRSLYERHAYACAIVKAAHGGAVSAACHLHTIADLKGRLKMLSVSRASRRRLLTGAGVVSTLVVAGLGLTASGTSAAKVLTASVERTTGISVPRAPAPPPPPAPADQAVPAAPPAPPAPAAPSTERLDQHITTITDDAGKPTVRIDRTDGTGQTVSVAMPEVSSVNCPGNAPEPVVVTSRKGKQQKILICTNRIEKMAANAASAASASSAKAAVNEEQIQRQALQAALAGLEAAKASLRSNSALTPDQLQEALAGIDEGMAEVRAEIATKED